MRVRPWFVAASASYLASCSLGLAVTSRRVRTDEIRWVHHALYVVTSTLAGTAASSVLWSRSRAGWLLLPAAVPFILIPRRSGRSREHALLALSAAPFFAASLITALRRTPPARRDRGAAR